MSSNQQVQTMRLLTPEQVAEMVQVKQTKTVSRLVNAGQLPRPVINTGNVRRWREEDILRHLAARANMG